MRSRIQAVVLPSFEASEFADDIRRLFAAPGRAPAQSLSGECSPALDVYETDDAIEVTVDLPGVDRSAIRILAKGHAILIVGEKAPRRSAGDSNFHLVERGFGRFARVIRLSVPYDPTRAHARLGDGELRLTLPKLAERRGHAIEIPLAPERA